MTPHIIRQHGENIRHDLKTLISTVLKTIRNGPEVVPQADGREEEEEEGGG